MLTKSHKSADFIYLFAEKIAYRFFADFFYKLPFSANQLSIINFFINNLGAVVFFSLGRYWANLVGVFFLVSSAIFDWMDGAVARKKGLASEGGGFLDSTLDYIWQNLLVAAIIFGVFTSKGGDLFWLVIGLLAFVSLVMNNHLGAIYGDNFGFGFRGDYDELIKKIDSSKKTGIFDRLALEMLTYRKFPFIFLFTIRYPLLLGALLNRLDIFLIFLLLTSLFKAVFLIYLYYLFLEACRRKKNPVITEVLIERYQFWLKEKKV